MTRAQGGVVSGNFPFRLGISGSIEDMTWCKRAFTSRLGNEQPDGQVIGLSYGIEERDLWSELVTGL